MSLPPSETKHDQRRTMREARRAVSRADRGVKSATAGKHLDAWLARRQAQRIALFVSLADEIDTAPLFEMLRYRGTEIALPRVRVAETHLDFVLVHDLKTLQPGPFRLLEPVGEPVSLSTIDAVVVPGLVFDRDGGRLGYGAGYYDRALATYDNPRIGFCYRFQLVDHDLPLAPHDRPMTAIAHEDGIHEVGT